MESGLVDHWKFKYQQAVDAEAASEKYYAERLAEALRKVDELERSWELTIADHQRTIQRATKLEGDLDEAKLRIAELEAAAQCVHDTFKSDLDQGYETKDKVFAVEVLGKALAGKGQ